MFLKEASYAQQGRIYLTKNTVKRDIRHRQVYYLLYMGQCFFILCSKTL